MNQSFIENLADYILAAFAEKTDRLNVVFPNKRAAVFLKRALGQKANKVIWMPQLRTIDEMFAEWTGKNSLDTLALSLGLVKVFAGQMSDNKSAVNQFVGYAAQLLHDFEEADRYLIDVPLLFQYLSEARAIELWHPDGSELSAYEKDYLAFYQSLGPLYDHFRQYMRETNVVSAATNARYLAELNEKALVEMAAGRFTLFAGFNAFNPAEEAVFEKLHRNGIADVRWDFDTYYLRPNIFGQHEAGAAARRFFEKHPSASKEWLYETLLTSSKKIQLVAAPGQIGQAKALGNKLKIQFDAGSEASDTAVVIADESLLFPVLNSIPPDIEKMNVTMGLPFTSSPMFILLLDLLRFEKSYSERAETNRVPADSLLSILRHPAIMHSLNNTSAKQAEKLINSILESGSNFVHIDWLLNQQELLIPEATQLFVILLNSPGKNAFESGCKLLELIEYIGSQHHATANTEADIIALNQISITRKLLNQLVDALSDQPELLEVSSLERLVRQIAPAYTQNLVGEPLEGLQIMGLLESRNLDFKIVHILSANEGILPSDTHAQSLVPYDIRRTFGLPTRNDSQAIFAFHFFRLLQRAEDITLYYNTEADTFGGGEMSRFLQQIKYELTRLNPKIELSEETFSFPIAQQQQNRVINIQKNQFVVTKINEKLSEGLSPTSLTRYLNCPLQFYLKDVLKLDDNQNATGTAQANKIGTVVHAAIEMLYEPWLNQTLSKEMINEMESRAELVLAQTFGNEFPGIQLTEGLNRITFAVAGHFIKNLLNSEKNTVETMPPVVLEQEKRIHKQLTVNGKKINIKGTIDRLDRVGGQIRIIDYKTGQAEQKDISISNPDELLLPEKAKALQLSIYTWLMLSDEINTETLPQSFLINLSKSSIGMIQLVLPTALDPATFSSSITQILEQITNDLIDESKPFSQTEDHKRCSNCTYIAICNRDKKNSTFF